MKCIGCAKVIIINIDIIITINIIISINIINVLVWENTLRAKNHCIVGGEES